MKRIPKFTSGVNFTLDAMSIRPLSSRKLLPNKFPESVREASLAIELFRFTRGLRSHRDLIPSDTMLLA